jgi:ADP-ribose pyrophosphatase
MNFRVTKSETIFHGNVFDVKVDEIEYNGTGNKASRQVAIHPGGAVILPVKDNGKIVLISQYRYPFNEEIYELPAGKLEKSEDPKDCATRELIEETGYSSNTITKLGKIFTTPGFCDEVLHIYLAENLIAGDHAREEGEEGMQMFEMTLDEIDKKIQDGEIVDAKTICGISMYKLKK